MRALNARGELTEAGLQAGRAGAVGCPGIGEARRGW